MATKVATLLRAAGHDVVTTRDLGRGSANDDEQLLTAAVQRRVFVTHNTDDFILLHDAWQRWSQAWQVAEKHAGILIVPQGRKHGVQWTPERIAEGLSDCVQRSLPVVNELLQYRDGRWWRRLGNGWVPCI
ncbi:MAG: DUF5615 family PIN-like protein [Chloroflexi bacterium]|nr:DUF5615 family PIN-like protein [Chloroflexota bacterium]